MEFLEIMIRNALAETKISQGLGGRIPLSHGTGNGHSTGVFLSISCFPPVLVKTP
jgi:hypothetical protein